MLPHRPTRPRPLKHGKDRAPPSRQAGRADPVTVCIATMCNWTYAPGDVGKAIITASDRQITSGSVEYDPLQIKVCFLNQHLLVLVSGDIAVHSEALTNLQSKLKTSPTSDVFDVAEMYSKELRRIYFRYAVNKYLSPLGMDDATFFGNQSTFSPEFINKITDQLQSYQGPEIEAIVTGIDDKGAHIYHIDEFMNISCNDDLGFAAIGLGAWHAKSQIMQFRYVTRIPYSPALSVTFLSKKRAEAAPGVGKDTDMFCITKNGWSPVLPELMEKLNELYTKYEDSVRGVAVNIMKELDDHLEELRKKFQDAEKKTIPDSSLS